MNVKGGGQNAKTVQAHKLEGTYDKAKHGDKASPAPEPGMPDPQQPLVGVALRRWRYVTGLLRNADMMTVVDGPMLYEYCQIFGAAEALRLQKRRLVRVFAKVRKPSLRDHLDHGRQLLQLDRQLLAYQVQIRMYLIEFGMSPASRGRVNLLANGVAIGGVQRHDDMAEFDAQPEPLRLVVNGSDSGA